MRFIINTVDILLRKSFIYSLDRKIAYNGIKFTEHVGCTKTATVCCLNYEHC